jgi:hypothetical protein
MPAPERLTDGQRAHARRVAAGTVTLSDHLTAKYLRLLLAETDAAAELAGLPDRWDRAADEQTDLPPDLSITLSSSEFHDEGVAEGYRACAAQLRELLRIEAAA